MGSRTQILKCKVLLKGNEFDFPLCKELKIDEKSIFNFFLYPKNEKLNWKLPKMNFQFFEIIEK